MELREFQKRVLNELSNYLSALEVQKSKYDKLRSLDPELSENFLFPKKAWEEIGLKGYTSSRSGLEEPVPDVYIKVPTGGGKTLLACHGIERIKRLYLKEQNGLVLWVVPTSQIYNQTLKTLRDRNHPYRQVLDRASGGRVAIYEKHQTFSLTDTEDNLCVLLLMLPSASRQTKDVLRVFKDNSGYTSFFPPEDAFEHQGKLLAAIPNLDTFKDQGFLFDSIPLTSLGNVLKLLRPLIVVDEGHKAFSKTARETLLSFNPRFMLELSATPPIEANCLSSVSGRELNDEEMIKLDLHVVNKNTVGWRETVTASISKREELEVESSKHEQNSGTYIRPIVLIQVERTGKDQRDGLRIHAEDVREYLVAQHGIAESHVAIKSSDKDDIEGIDLLGRDCEIRYIITKQALQEGWDCPFAYVLCVLTNSQSEVGMTQLIGRILRQPYARKTRVQPLDESYLFTFQSDTNQLVRGIKRNLEGEGLGDLVGRVSFEDEGDENTDFEPTVLGSYRDEFKRFKGKVLLPIFATFDKDNWRELSYSQDLMSKVDWSKVDLGDFDRTKLDEREFDDEVLRIGFKGDSLSPVESAVVSFKSHLNAELVTRQLLDVVPNPWVAYEIATKAIESMVARYDVETVASNLAFMVEELRRHLYVQRDLLTEGVFKKGLADGTIQLCLLSTSSSGIVPDSRTYRSKRRLTRDDGNPLAKSLYDYVPSEAFNGLEARVADYLDSSGKLLWWYRNISLIDYKIQGWKPGRVYPDFLAATDRDGTWGTLYILETKGEQLAGNVDTEYKRGLMEMCNRLPVAKAWADLGIDELDRKFDFRVIDESMWRTQLNELFS